MSAPALPKREMVLPEFGKIPPTTFYLEKTHEAEQRLIEAKTVNPITYADLEYCFNESYREMRRNLNSIGYQITLVDKMMEQAKSKVLLDTYPEFLKNNDMKKSQDNADLRKAFLMRDPDYLAALDRMNQLKAIENNFDGKIKVMEKVCQYMRKQMDLILRSGLSGKDLYQR